MMMMMLNVSVARWERGLQGFDDDPDWWLHPLLPYAHRSQCGQVQHCHHRRHRNHHHRSQIYNTSFLLLLKIIINSNDEVQSLMTGFLSNYCHHYYSIFILPQRKPFLSQ